MIPAIKVTVDDKALRETLARLPERLNERARKNGARRALAPYVKQIAAIWAAAPYEGKPVHRKAIAAATKLDVRRVGSGPTAPLRARIGVQYGRKGGARAKGRQRVWHLLEAGFRHKAAGRKIPGAFRSYRWARQALQGAMAAVSRETLLEARKLLGAGR